MELKGCVVGVTDGKFTIFGIFSQCIRIKAPVAVVIIFVMLAEDQGIIGMNPQPGLIFKFVSPFQIAVRAKNQTIGHIAHIIVVPGFHNAVINAGHSGL